MSYFHTLLLTCTLLPTAALGADPTLLNLVMPDAKLLAGLDVARAKASPFGLYILSHMQPDDPNFKKFIAATGFDPRRDLTEIIICSSASTDVTSHLLVVAHGGFDAQKFAAAALANDGKATPFQGVDILSVPNSDNVLAIPENATAIIGDLVSVEGAIQRFQTKATGSGSLLSQVGTVSPKYDFYFLTLVGLSEFANAMPDSDLGQAMNSNLFQAVTQASGGLKFGTNVQFALQATTLTPKDAEALASVVRFLAGMIKTGASATLLDSVMLTTAANVMTLSLSIPEATIEQLLESTKKVKKQAAQVYR